MGSGSFFGSGAVLSQSALDASPWSTGCTPTSIKSNLAAFIAAASSSVPQQPSRMIESPREVEMITRPRRRELIPRHVRVDVDRPEVDPPRHALDIAEAGLSEDRGHLE